MSLIDLASLVLAPTATKEGKVYSAIPNTGEGDMTFSRASSATRVNSAGLIEKARTNLLLQSNTFDTWGGTRLFSLTGGQTGYDGSSDAWLMIPNNSSNTHYFNQNVSAGTGVMTVSIYAKGGGYNYFAIRDDSNDSYARFDLSLGVTSIKGTNAITSSIELIGNGWYRCSLTFTETASGNLLFYINDAYNYAGNYIGDEVSGVYFQDAQLELGLVATDYIETTTASVSVGIIDDVPRVDYSGGGCPSLKLEPQRTNLLPYSEYLDSFTKFGSTSVTSNTAVSPEGYTNASTISTSGSSVIRQSVTLSANTVYTYSIFVKKKAYDLFGFQSLINGAGVRSVFNLNTGVVTTQGSGHTANIINYGNGWFRCIVTFNCGSSTSNIFDLATNTSVGTLEEYYCYGAMLEAGSYPTSYIPTFGTSVTRVADACYKTGISSLIGQTEGTLFVDFVCNGIKDQYANIINSEKNVTNSFYIHFGLDGVIRAGVFANSVQRELAPSGFVVGQRYKLAFAYKSGDLALYSNGVQKATSALTFAFNSSLDDIYLNDTTTYFGYQENFNINEVILFPTRLTNDQLAELTKL